VYVHTLFLHTLFPRFLLTPPPPHYLFPQEQKKEFEKKSLIHKVTHTRARNYFRDAVRASQKHPDQVECYNADAPTNSRFELPRLNTDPPKCLEGIKKWKQKVMGVWCYGYGMKFYITAGAHPDLHSHHHLQHSYTLGSPQPTHTSSLDKLYLVTRVHALN
jgi:hypothetical protein